MGNNTELLIGVVHQEEFLDDVNKVIKQKSHQGIESLMLEIPSNWHEIKKYYALREGFFLKLAEQYEKGGTRIIFGGKPLGISYNPSCLNILLDALMHIQDKHMIKVIQEQNPQIVVAGLTHANYIKRKFPNVHYVAFKVTPYDKDDELVIKVLGRPYNPNEVITVTNRLSKEYYYRKYGIA